MRSIKPSNNHGSIRLRFTHQGNRYSLSLGDWYSSADRADALATAARIQADIRAKAFDTTLARYQCKHQLSIPSTNITAATALDLYLGQANHSPSTAKHTDQYVHRVVAGELNLDSTTISTTTFNRRLNTIHKAIQWAKDNGYTVSDDHWSNMTKAKPKTRPIRPFTFNELVAIISAVTLVNDHYVDFTKFLAISGCRFGEVTGLQHDCINRQTNEIHIRRTLSRSNDHWGFELKQSTKTGSVRVLKSRQLVELCGGGQDGHVFKSVTGQPINRSYYRTYVWTPALMSAGLDYRKLHTLRHTALSMAIESGLSVPQVAGLAGHKDSTMVVRTYGHVIEKAAVPVMEL